VAPPEVISGLNAERRIVFRFCDEKGNITPESNPNGAMENITGVISPEGNVLAMMPHPERASEKILGSEDGKKVFLSMIAHIEAAENA
jgi:phosphoribosylformylglycinamidine synthase